MNENRKKLNGRSSRQSRKRTERMEKFLKDTEKFLSRDYMLNVVAERMQEEYAAASANYEPTDEDLEAQAKEEADFRRDIIRERKYKVIRKFFQEGIELKKDDPDSKLFKTAEQLLELLDQAESDISSIDKHQSRRYATLVRMYVQLLDAEMAKQIGLKKTAETAPDIAPAKDKKKKAKIACLFKKIIGWIFKKTSHFIFAIIVAVVVAVIAAIVVDVLADFGWLERIKSFIYEILQINRNNIQRATGGSH